MPSSTENRLLEELVARGYTTHVKIGKAFKEQGRLLDQSKRKIPLSQILLSLGEISFENFLESSQAIGNRALSCSRCRLLYSIPLGDQRELKCTCGQALQRLSSQGNVVTRAAPSTEQSQQEFDSEHTKIIQRSQKPDFDAAQTTILKPQSQLQSRKPQNPTDSSWGAKSRGRKTSSLDTGRPPSGGYPAQAKSSTGHDPSQSGLFHSLGGVTPIHGIPAMSDSSLSSSLTKSSQLHRSSSQLGADKASLDDTSSFKSLLQEGAAFGPYQLTSELGQGAAGIVFAARHPEFEYPVAIKILNERLSRRPKSVRRFLREGAVMQQLEHENIVKVFDFGQVGNRYYLVMELITGQDLYHSIKASSLETSEALWIAERIACGLHAAHEHGIIHRDIKPENVLIDGAGHPRITDFGLAKQSKDDLSLTKTGVTVGTPYYMSPEQIKSARNVDRRTDIYSLGVLSYQLITDRLPFLANNQYDLFKLVFESTPTAPSKLVKSLNSDVDSVIFKAMAKKREERYETADALADDLAAVRAGRRPPSIKRGFFGFFK